MESSSRAEQATKVDIYTSNIVFIVAGTMAALFNVLEMALILKYKIKTNFQKALFSLAVADELSGLLFLAGGIVGELTRQQYITTNTVLTVLLMMISPASTILSTCHVLLIAFDRFYAVYFPLRCHVMPKSRINCLIALIWVISSIILTVFLAVVLKYKAVITMLTMTYGFLLASGCLIGISYTLIAAKMSRCILNKNIGTVSSSMSRIQNRVLANATIITVCFIACYYPIAIMMLSKTVDGIGIGASIHSFNCVFNPIIYSVSLLSRSRLQHRRTEATLST